VRRRKRFVFGIDEIAIDSEIAEKIFLELWDVIGNDEGKIREIDSRVYMKSLPKIILQMKKKVNSKQEEFCN